MSDIQNIKDRIKKLMAYANDGSATDGEIENALGHAQKLIDRYHLDKADFEAGDEQRDDGEMGTVSGKTASSKFHAWETTLANAIAELFGCIKHYLSSDPIPLRDKNGVVQFYTGKYAGQRKMCRQVVFYGPLVEVTEAAELFTEWCESIATMGVMRWGGAYRGNGEAYCQGFATSCWRKAKELNESRKLVAAKPVALLPGEHQPAQVAIAGSTAITLASRYETLKERAKQYLEEELEIELGSGTKRSGAKSGSMSAYEEGVKHGKAAGFGRQSKRKQLPGS